MAPPNRPWFWIASLIKRKASTRPALAYDVHCAVGRPARTTAGLVAAAISGTRSILEECAPHVSTSGLRHSAFLVPAGRHIPTGMRTDTSLGCLHLFKLTNEFSDNKVEIGIDV